MAVLEARGLSVRFGGVQALEDVDFVVEEGEIVGVLGPNGAGKTTFFNCVSGFVTPDAGQVLLHEADVTKLRPDERTRRGLGRTFQQVGLVRSFTVLENLLVAQHLQVGYGDAAGMFGAPWAFQEERTLERRALEVLDFLGLLHLRDERLDGLPYGLLKVCEVAAVLAVDPQVLMLDEPLAGMGPEESEAFGERLLDMRRELGISIVLVDHHVRQVLAVSDFVYVLNFGRLLARGVPDEIRDDPAVAEAYMGEGASSLA
jgi:branched-chain amino acid transport system ATP-binding protein